MIAIRYQAETEIFINQAGSISIKQDDPEHSNGASVVVVSMRELDSFIKALRKVARGEDE